MAYWVYLAECYKDRQLSCYYTGQTNNLDIRQSQHIHNVIIGNIKEFTGRFDYVKIVWAYKVETRQEAMALERSIKEGLSHDEKKDLVEGKINIEDLFYRVEGDE